MSASEKEKKSAWTSIINCRKSTLPFRAERNVLACEGQGFSSRRNRRIWVLQGGRHIEPFLAESGLTRLHSALTYTYESGKKSRGHTGALNLFILVGSGMPSLELLVAHYSPAHWSKAESTGAPRPSYDAVRVNAGVAKTIWAFSGNFRVLVRQSYIKKRNWNFTKIPLRATGRTDILGKTISRSPVSLSP